MREWIGTQMLHFGWALFGQECDCGDNHFNWLARQIDGNANWDDELNEPVGFWYKVRWNIGHAFVLASSRVRGIQRAPMEGRK